MAKFKGSKGSLMIGGTAVGEMLEWEINIARPYIEGTVMGDTAKKGDLDLPGATGRARVKLDYGNAQQASVLDMLVTDADPTPLAALFRASTTGPKQISCNVLPTSAAITARVLGGHIEATINFESDGAISIAWT